MKNNDDEYLRIIRKYNIPDNLTLHQVNRIILKELKKNHPDISNKSNAEEIFKEINNDNLFIKKLIREYGENYIYKVNPKQNTNHNNSNYNNNNSNNYNNNNNNNYNNNNNNNSNYNNNNYNNNNNNYNNNHNARNKEDIDDEIQKFKSKLYDIKSRYYYVNDIVSFVNYLLNDRLNNVTTKYELNQIKKQLNFNVRYYFLIFIIHHNKIKYEDPEIDRLSEQILNILSNVKTEKELIRIESEYYNQITPIENRIKKEIDAKTKPIEKIIKNISNYNNLKISYTEESRWINKLNSIYSVKKIDSTIKDIIFEIKLFVISKIKNLLNTLNSDYYDYATQLLLEIDSIQNIQKLNNIIKDYNDYLSKYIKKESNIIKNRLLEFANKYELDDYENNKINEYNQELDKIKDIDDFLDLNNTIKNYRLDILKSVFRKKLYHDNSSKLKTNYIYKIYNMKTEEQMLELMNEYENDLQKEKKNKEILAETKNEIINVINNLKIKYHETNFISDLNHFLWRINYSDNIEDLERVVNDIEIGILNFEKNKFLREIYHDINDTKLHDIAWDVHNKIYQIENITDLKNLKEYYYKEKEKYLNFEEIKNK